MGPRSKAAPKCKPGLRAEGTAAVVCGGRGEKGGAGPPPLLRPPPHPSCDAALANYSSTLATLGDSSAVETFESLSPVFNSDSPLTYNPPLTTGSSFASGSCYSGQWSLSSSSWTQRPYGAWPVGLIEMIVFVQ